jgi:hypothetical protein
MMTEEEMELAFLQGFSRSWTSCIYWNKEDYQGNGYQ